MPGVGTSIAIRARSKKNANLWTMPGMRVATREEQQVGQSIGIAIAIRAPAPASLGGPPARE
jgi:hypothetical protein